MGAFIRRAGRRPQVAVRKTMPHRPVEYMVNYSRRAAFQDGPYDGPGWGLSFVVMPPFIGEVA